MHRGKTYSQRGWCRCVSPSRSSFPTATGFIESPRRFRNAPRNPFGKGETETQNDGIRKPSRPARRGAWIVVGGRSRAQNVKENWKRDRQRGTHKIEGTYRYGSVWGTVAVRGRAWVCERQNEKLFPTTLQPLMTTDSSLRAGGQSAARFALGIPKYLLVRAPFWSIRFEGTFKFVHASWGSKGPLHALMLLCMYIYTHTHTHTNKHTSKCSRKANGKFKSAVRFGVRAPFLQPLANAPYRTACICNLTTHRTLSLVLFSLHGDLELSWASYTYTYGDRNDFVVSLPQFA